MSLDVYLKRKKWISYDAGKTLTEEVETVYDANITHNLGKMAHMCKIMKSTLYYYLWRPDEIGVTKAEQLIIPLTKALAKLKDNRTYYEKFNSENGWGMYEHFVPFVKNYLNACVEFPYSDIEIGR